MARHEGQTSFSDRWHRVRDLRPALSPHAQWVRQRRGFHTTYIIEEPAGGHYFRLTEPAWFFVGMLDGKRTVDEAWEACCVQLGDAAPTQREAIDSLAQLQRHGLLLHAEGVSPELVERRIFESRRERLDKRKGRFIFPTIPLFNPEPMLRRYEPLLRMIYSRPMLVLWIVLLAAGGYAVVANWGRFTSGLNGLLDPFNLFLMALLFLVIRAVHELGHATAAKAMGGRSSEIGVIMVALVLPIPYCDATSAHLFPQTWRRVLVGAAGIMVETFFAAIAAIVWASTEPGTINTLAYNTVIISGISTIMFNMNPLLRYDGYYILSDLAGSPNLAQRAKEFWRFMWERKAFDVRGLRPPIVRSRGEAWLLGIYGVLSPPYRLFIGLAIVLLVSTKYLTLGIVLAVVMVCLMFLWPAAKLVHYFATSPRLVGRRMRAVGVAGGVLAALVVLIGVIPAPAGAHAAGVIEPIDRRIVRTQQAGFVREVLIEPGQRVEAGAPLLVMESLQVAERLVLAREEAELARIALDASIGNPAREQIAREELSVRLAQLRSLEQDEAELTVRTPIAGIVAAPGAAGPDVAALQGRFLTEGQALFVVHSEGEMVVRAAISDRERAYVFKDGAIDLVPASIRVRGDAWRAIDARAAQMSPVASNQLDSAALGTGFGGSVLVDPRDRSGTTALTPYAAIEVRPLEPLGTALAGQRVRVRFEAPPAPIGAQVWRWLSQTFARSFEL